MEWKYHKKLLTEECEDDDKRRHSTEHKVIKSLKKSAGSGKIAPELIKHGSKKNYSYSASESCKWRLTT